MVGKALVGSNGLVVDHETSTSPGDEFLLFLRTLLLLVLVIIIEIVQFLKTSNLSLEVAEFPFEGVEMDAGEAGEATVRIGGTDGGTALGEGAVAEDTGRGGGDDTDWLARGGEETVTWRAIDGGVGARVNEGAGYTGFVRVIGSGGGADGALRVVTLPSLLDDNAVRLGRGGSGGGAGVEAHCGGGCFLLVWN